MQLVSVSGFRGFAPKIRTLDCGAVLSLVLRHSGMASPNLNQVSPKTRSRADKKPGVLRLPCKRVEAKSTVNCGMFDLRLYCPSTWVHTSYLVLLPQLAQLLLKVYSTGR